MMRSILTYKSSLTVIGILSLIALMASCSNNDSDSITNCERSNWIGTYDKIDESCDNAGMPFFEDVLFFEAGKCETCLTDNSTTQYMISEDCKMVHITPLSWVIEHELDEDFIYVVFDAADCSATYKRRI